MTQMSPPIGMIIPYFFILSRTNMLDSYAGLIAIHMTLTVPFSIWLMITYFQDIPVSLEKSAAIDGASPFSTFLRVVLPTAWGGVGVTAIFAFIESWNEFLYAVVLTGSQTKTVPVAIFGFLTTEESLWGPFTYRSHHHGTGHFGGPFRATPNDKGDDPGRHQGLIPFTAESPIGCKNMPLNGGLL